MHVRLDIGHVAGCDLRIHRSIQVDDAQIERRRVRQRASRGRAVDEARPVGQPRGAAHERRSRNRTALAAASGNDPQHLVPDRGPSTLKRDPRIVARPTRSSPEVAARHVTDRLRIRAVARDRRQDDATLVGAQKRDATAVVTDVASPKGADNRAWKPAQRGDLPERALSTGRLRRRVVDEGARIRRPSGIQVIDVVPRHLKRCASSQEPNPHLTLAVHRSDKRHHLAVRRDGR